MGLLRFVIYLSHVLNLQINARFLGYAYDTSIFLPGTDANERINAANVILKALLDLSQKINQK